MKMVKKIILILSLCTGIFFISTFLVYFFNLDMKTAAKISPLLDKHYDSIPRHRTM